MASKPLEPAEIDPGLLDQHLPDRPYGVEAWCFVLETGQVNFVKVDAFNRGEHYLRLPVFLGIRTTPLPIQRERQTPHNVRHHVDQVFGSEGDVLGTVDVQRFPDDVWRAVLRRNDGAQVGDARGRTGNVTPDDLISVAVAALWRHTQRKSLA